jgi:hypothetical protein
MVQATVQRLPAAEVGRQPKFTERHLSPSQIDRIFAPCDVSMTCSWCEYRRE